MVRFQGSLRPRRLGGAFLQRSHYCKIHTDGKSRTLSSPFSVPGSRFLVPGSWFSVPGSWFLVLGSRFSVLGSWFLILGSRFSFPLPLCTHKGKRNRRLFRQILQGAFSRDARIVACIVGGAVRCYHRDSAVLAMMGYRGSLHNRRSDLDVGGRDAHAPRGCLIWSL